MFPSANQTLVVQATNPAAQTATPPLRPTAAAAAASPRTCWRQVWRLVHPAQQRHAPGSQRPRQALPGCRGRAVKGGGAGGQCRPHWVRLPPGEADPPGQTSSSTPGPQPPGPASVLPRAAARLCKLIRRHVCLIYSSYSIKCVPCFYMKCIVRELICQMMCASLPRRGTTFSHHCTGR